MLKMSKNGYDFRNQLVQKKWLNHQNLEKSDFCTPYLEIISVKTDMLAKNISTMARRDHLEDGKKKTKCQFGRRDHLTTFLKKNDLPLCDKSTNRGATNYKSYLSKHVCQQRTSLDATTYMVEKQSASFADATT